MAKQTDLERIWDIIERVQVCMFTTRCADGLRARPLEARPNREEGVIWFVTDLHSDKEREIASEHDVGLVFVDGKRQCLPFHYSACRSRQRSCQGGRNLEEHR
jgi:general stress protein 26